MSAAVYVAVPVRGSIWMDAGAMHAIRGRHKSLFPVGVIKVVGEFSAQVRQGFCVCGSSVLALRRQWAWVICASCRAA
jgi:glutamate 5-kinase